MRHWRRLAATMLVAVLLAGSARGAEDASGKPDHEPDPRAALSAAALNVLFLPVRIPLTVFGAALAGVTGFLTFGGVHAANDVFSLFDGTQVLNERVLDGREPFCVGRAGCER